MAITAVGIVPPTLAISGAATVNQGTAYTLNLSATETDADTISGWTINWGDGSTPQAVSGNPSSVSHVYGAGTNAELNTYTITATATDQHGTYSANSQIVSVGQNIFFDPGFESPVQTGGGNAYTYDPSGTSWTFTGNSGIQANGSAWGAATAPEGTQTAFLQAYSSVGGSISQSVALSAGSYAIQFDAAQRGGETQPLAVSVDGTQIGNAITPASSSFAQYTTAGFTVSAGVHTITFSTTDNIDGDRSSFLDNVSIVQVPTVTTIPTVTVSEGASPTTIDLSQYFSEANIAFGDSLTYSITGNTSTSLVSTSISGSMLTLSYPASYDGTATITVTATDLNGNTASTSFQVIVHDSPTLVHTALEGSVARDTTQVNAGLLVSSLTGGITDSDPAGLQGIAIVSTDQAHGTIQYSTDNGSTWTNVGSVSDIRMPSCCPPMPIRASGWCRLIPIWARHRRDYVPRLGPIQRYGRQLYRYYDQQR